MIFPPACYALRARVSGEKLIEGNILGDDFSVLVFDPKDFTLRLCLLDRHAEAVIGRQPGRSVPELRDVVQRNEEWTLPAIRVQAGAAYGLVGERGRIGETLDPFAKGLGFFLTACRRDGAHGFSCGNFLEVLAQRQTTRFGLSKETSFDLGTQV